MEVELLLVDGKNLAVRNFCAYPRTLTDGSGNATNLIHGSLLEIFRFKEKFNPGTVAICWDRSSAFRKLLYPGYKANPARKSALSDSEWKEFDRQLRIFKEGVLHLPIYQFEIEGTEADDLISYIALRWGGGDRVIASSDRDFWQLVSKEISVYDTRKKLLLTVENFTEETGFKNPLEYLAYRCLRGDHSDHIPGVPKFGEIRSREAAGYLARKLPQPEKAWTQKYIEWGTNRTVKRQLMLNFLLMSLPTAVQMQEQKFREKMEWDSRWDLRRFTDFCREHKLKMVYEQFSNSVQ